MIVRGEIYMQYTRHLEYSTRACIVSLAVLDAKYSLGWKYTGQTFPFFYIPLILCCQYLLNELRTVN